MLSRVLEPEVMDTVEEAIDYDSMDHNTVNRLFVDHLLTAARDVGVVSHTELQILDVGTGTALIPIELCRRLQTGRVRAIDLAAEMLKLARANIARAGLTARIEPELIDAKTLPYPDASFDWVISNSIIHHIPDPSLCLSEMRRVLKPGGLLFVRDLFRPDSAEAIEHIVQTYAGGDSARQQQLFRQSLHAALTVEEMRDLAESLGLRRDSVNASSDRHWTLALRPPA